MAKQKIRRKHSRSSHALRTPAARKVKSKAVAPVPLAASPALAHKTLTVVGLGASVGGLEALEEFFKHTPPDSGIVFVVVTHQHPGHTSLLPELLRKSAAMPVAEASKSLPVKPNCIYGARPEGYLALLNVRQLKQPSTQSGLILLAMEDVTESREAIAAARKAAKK